MVVMPAGALFLLPFAPQPLVLGGVERPAVELGFAFNGLVGRRVVPGDRIEAV
jgi:hypothetical protein